MTLQLEIMKTVMAGLVVIAVCAQWAHLAPAAITILAIQLLSLLKVATTVGATAGDKLADKDAKSRAGSRAESLPAALAAGCRSLQRVPLSYAIGAPVAVAVARLLRSCAAHQPLALAAAAVLFGAAVSALPRAWARFSASASCARCARCARCGCEGPQECPYNAEFWADMVTPSEAATEADVVEVVDLTPILNWD